MDVCSRLCLKASVPSFELPASTCAQGPPSTCPKAGMNFSDITSLSVSLPLCLFLLFCYFFFTFFWGGELLPWYLSTTHNASDVCMESTVENLEQQSHSLSASF